MAARSTFTRSAGNTITAALNNSIRDHLPTYTTSNDVSTEGQLCVNTSTDKLVVYSGAAVVELANYGAWKAYTTTITQSFGVAHAQYEVEYMRSGRNVTATGQLYFTGNGSVGNPITCTTNLPAPPRDLCVGSFVYQEVGTGSYTGSIMMSTASVLTFQCHNVNSVLGQTPSFAIIATDSIWLQISYKATSAS